MLQDSWWHREDSKRVKCTILWI